MLECELYAHVHGLIGDLAQSAEPETDWQTRLRLHIDNFEANADALSAAAARLLRKELCTQLEHEALCSTRSLTREILIAAMKWLEQGG